MRRALTAAMKARDQRAVTALRSALAAIDNAEAVDTIDRAVTPTAPPGEGHPAAGGEIAGAAVGLGAAEVERRVLTPAEVEAILRGELAERMTAAHAYERAGQPGRAKRLRAEAEVLRGQLDPPDNLAAPGA